MIVSRYHNTIVYTSPWILSLNETKMPRVNLAPLASFDNKIIDSIDSFTNRFPNRVSRSDRKPLRCVSGSRTTRSRETGTAPSNGIGSIFFVPLSLDNLHFDAHALISPSSPPRIIPPSTCCVNDQRPTSSPKLDAASYTKSF